MTDEAPLVKPKAKNIASSLKLPPRLNSDGHFQQTDIDPEIKRNMPSIVEEKQTKEDTKLNVNANPFTPKFLEKNKNQNEPKNSNHGFQPRTFYNNVNPMNMNMNMNINAFYQNQNNMNINQQVGPYDYNNHRNFFNNYPNIQSQTNYQQYPNYYLNNNYYNQYQPPINNKLQNYKKAQNQQKREPGEPYIPKKYQFNDNYNIRNSMPVPQSNDNTVNGPKNSIGLSRLSFEAPAYIPKSKRNGQETNNLTNTQNENNPSNNTNMNNLSNNSNTNNGEENIELNLNSPTYMPTNVELKKKEEQIQKEKETAELETPKEEAKNKRSNEKEEEKDKKIEKEKKEVQKPPTSLKDILLNPDLKIESKNSNKEINRKSDNKEIINYPKNINKKSKNLLNKKIDALKEKDKKIKETEEKKQKEQERIRKIEEEKRRKEAEEERQRKEEERKKKEEEKKKKKAEELKKKLELEEKRKKEEEERKKKEEEEKRKEEELKKEQERIRKEEEEKRKEEEEKNKVIEKKYFIVFKNKKSEKKEYKYTFEYIMQFQKWKISNEDELLTNVAKQHFEGFKEVEKDEGKPKKRDNRDQKPPFFKPRSTQPNYAQIQASKEEPIPLNPSSSEGGMEQWARKDMTKEIKAAEEFKHKLEETIKDDPKKRDLRDFLNMLTKDNYDSIKKRIFDAIKDDVNDQIKFLDVLFQKAVSEQSYVEIYAKLCKDLDKDLPQKSINKEQKNNGKPGGKPQKPTSEMRKKLLDKCKEIFQIENNEKFDEYIKVKDPEERENKLKKFVLGNVYFITELIKNKILSKKIAPVCMKNLFKRYEDSKGDEKLKLIHIQAIVIFADQFGTLLHSQEKKIANDDAKSFKSSIDDIFEKLDKVKDEKNFPSFIKYRIINLIEKKKNNYQKSKLEEYRIAKSKKELEQELENQGQITQDNINDKIKKGLIEYKDFVEEEGTSEKYPWKETTHLYDEKKKPLDDILEGYIVNCGDFIEKESNIKYAKNYIKELIDYYGDKIHKKEKKELKNRLFKLLDIVKDTAIDIPSIYDIYSYVIFIFLDNNIMEVNDLEEIIDEKNAIDEDYKIISDIFKKAYDYYKEENFREEVAKFNFVKNNSKLFEWLYKEDEEEKEKSY